MSVEVNEFLYVTLYLVNLLTKSIMSNLSSVIQRKADNI